MSQFTKFLVLLSFVLTMVGSSHALESQTYYSKKFESSIQKNGKVIFEGADQFTKFDFGIPLNRSGALLVGFKDLKVLNDKKVNVRTHIRYGNIDFSVGICFEYYSQNTFMAARTSFKKNDWGGLKIIMPSGRFKDNNKCIGKWELADDRKSMLGELGIYALMDDIQQKNNTRKLLEVLDEQTNGSLCFILTNIISKENCVKISETETVDTEESIEKELAEFESELAIELSDNLFSSVDDFSVAVSKRKAEAAEAAAQAAEIEVERAKIAAARAKRLAEEKAAAAYIATEKKASEERKIAEAEEKRIAKVEAARIAEEKRIADKAARIVKEKKAAEEKRVTEEKRIAKAESEAARIAEELLNKKLALIIPQKELQNAQDFLNHIQVFAKNNPGEFDIIKLTEFMILSRPILVDGLYDKEQIENLEVFKQFTDTSSAFVEFISKEQEKETQIELEKINNLMASLSKNITRLGLASEINSIFETSLTEQKKSAQLILDNPKTLSELQNAISSISHLLEEINSTEKQIQIAQRHIAKLTAYLQENMMSDLAPGVLSNLKIITNVISEESINKLISIGDSPSEYIGSIVEDTATFIDQDFVEGEVQLELAIALEAAVVEAETNAIKLEEKKPTVQKSADTNETKYEYYSNGQKKSEENYKDGKEDGKHTFWYENGQIEKERNYKDGKRDGRGTIWYENGQKESEGNHKDGKLYGKGTSWNENGQKVAELNLKDDKQDGKSTTWYENGQKSLEVNYKDGKLYGKLTSWSETGQKVTEVRYKDDKEDGKSTTWYENGQKKVEVNYKDGKLYGKHTSWFKNGKKQVEVNYKDGKRDGKRTEWYENGQKESEGNLKDGKLYGKRTSWNKNGWKEIEGNFNKSGKQHGKMTMWFENGQKKAELNYINGKQHGKMIVWDKNGRKEGEFNYKNGECSSVTFPKMKLCSNFNL